MSDTKISVIIPLYNAEKFIRQTLISVLASKFKDYEVLVVDDCSTDSSVAEAEKLLPHFDGRLKILSTEKNSGGAGVPRNVGIKNSAGKYICFLDADDFLLPTALGDFFDVAEKFSADVLHTEKFLTFDNTGESNFKREDLILRRDETGKPVEVPTLEPDDLHERIHRCAEGRFLWMPWGKLYRRTFLVENKIDFPDMAFTEDLVFGFECYICAKKYLRVPFVTNIYRMNQNSVSKKIISSRDGVKLWLRSVTDGMSFIAKFMDEHKFFRQPDVKYLVADFLVPTYFRFIKNLFQGMKPHEVEEIFYDELQNPALNPTGKNLLVAHMCAKRVLTR
ncbi:MAG: glycosyltransferase family 2 protein [Selenomonadaceae bacterium]|nr:glycosyltransferase family 2 protein [Selenomonadaceae bacterium]